MPRVYESLPVSGKNLIGNGNFNIWQRGTSFTLSSATSPIYCADRFRGLLSNSTASLTLSQETTIVPAGSTKSLKVLVGTADASVGASDHVRLITSVEGYDIIGFANAKFLTLSFWVYSSVTGTYGICFNNSGATAFYNFEYTINSANTWEKKIFTVPYDNTRSWNFDNQAGIQVIWELMAGSSVVSSLVNTWTAGSTFGTPNQVNFCANNGNTLYLAQVQLEFGQVATEFEALPMSLDLLKCQRYYEKSYDFGTNLGTATDNGKVYLNVGTATTGSLFTKVWFKAEKRAVPTVVMYDDAGTINTVSKGANGKAAASAYIGTTGFAGGTNDATSSTNVSFQWTAESDI